MELLIAVLPQYTEQKKKTIMKKREAIYWVVIIVLLAVCNHLWEENRRRGVVAVIDTDTMLIAPVAKDSAKVGTVSVTVKPGFNTKAKRINTKLTENVPAEPDSVSDGVTVTIHPDSTATVDIPITQKVYEDSAYTAWVSGYRATLDSIRIRERTVIVAGEPQHTGRQRISIGLTGGYGLVGLHGQYGLGPFVGVGVTVPLWPRK